MQSQAPTVEHYLDELPDDRREAIAAVRDVILANLPDGYDEVMQYGMISYVIPRDDYPDTYNAQPLAVASLASQKHHMALYLMCVYGDEESRFRERYEATGKRLDMGKSCVRFRALDDLPLELIGEEIAAQTPETFIAAYEASPEEALMATVETMRGPIDTADLGRTLMHEHVFILSHEIQDNYRTEFDPDVEVPQAIARLDELKAVGIDTIVDLTVIGLGRRMDLLEPVVAATELNIIVATGLYTYNELPHYFRFRGGPGTLLGGDDPLLDMFLADAQEGVGRTTVKPAIIKCATDEEGLTPDVERVLRACAQTHRRTGLPISTHTHTASERGLEQQRVFAEEGVDLSRVVIGHSGDTTDLGYLEKLIDNGSFIGMDRFGVDAYLSFDDRVQVVADLCARGYAERMVLSHDAACHLDWMPTAVRSFQPNWHYTHISRDVLPALREHGVSDSQIDQMLVANPRAIFDRHDPY